MPNFCELCRVVATKENLSFLSVPTNEERRRRWIESCGKDLKKSSRVCQKHFDQVDFINPPGNKKCRLMPSALPKRFLNRGSKSAAHSSEVFDFANARYNGSSESG